MQKRALAIHDISCVGRCSLTVALPILSAGGRQHVGYPYGAFVHPYGPNSLAIRTWTCPISCCPSPPIWKRSGCISTPFYSGYLASAEQVNLVAKITDMLCDENTRIFVDPAFCRSRQAVFPHGR